MFKHTISMTLTPLRDAQYMLIVEIENHESEDTSEDK